MIATSIKTIREHVIALLIDAGYSPIEATNRWNNTYSKEYLQAQPGKTVRWLIGQNEFEFTKGA